MVAKLRTQLQAFRLAFLRKFGKIEQEQLPPLFVIDDRICEWKGDLAGACCAMTGQKSFVYDVFQNEQGDAVLVSANASHKIQAFIRNREAKKFAGPMEFVVYGCRVRIVDKRIEGKARAIKEEGSDETPVGDAAIA